MIQTHRTSVFTALTAILLTLMLSGLGGCGGRRTSTLRTPSSQPLTKSAQTTYDFLLYHDQLQRIQRHAAEGQKSPLTPEQIAEYHERAVEALSRLLEESPTPQLYLEKAGLFWNHPEGPARSRAALKKGLAEFPDNLLLTVYLANTYVMDDRVQAAVDVMDDYLAKHPDDIEARERLGQMLMDGGKDAEALDVLKKIPADKRSADVFYYMGRVQGNLGMRKVAVTNLKKSVEMAPHFTEAMVELAYQYELAKDYVAAEKTYERILTQNDSFPEARLRLINLNLKLNNPAKALDVTLNGPPSKSFILDAVLMFINDEFYAQGSTALDMLTSDGPIPAEYYFYKAVIANEGENDPKKALEFLQKVEKEDRLYPHALRFKAQLLNGMGREEEALTIASEGKKLFPDGTIFYILEAALLQGKGDVAGAEKSLKEGLDRLKNDPELTYELAMLYDQTDRREQGIELMETVVRAYPDHANALNYVGYTLAEENRDLDRALVLVKKASKLDPENGFILDSVAWVYYKLKQYDKAWEYIGYAVDVADKDPTIWEHYGDIARALGKTRAARKGYNYSLRLGTPHPETVKGKLKDL